MGSLWEGAFFTGELGFYSNVTLLMAFCASWKATSAKCITNGDIRVDELVLLLLSRPWLLPEEEAANDDDGRERRMVDEDT